MMREPGLPGTQDGHVLALNSGSSSLKAGLYRTVGAGDCGPLVLAVELDRIGATGGRQRVRDGQGGLLAELQGDFPDFQAAFKALFAALAKHAEPHRLVAVGHRIVHGGPRYAQPQWVSPQLMAALRELVARDPDHLPQALAGIDYINRMYAGLPQAACFDTTFHRRMPRVAQMVPLPRQFQDEGMVRFGFHGLSYESIICALRELDPAGARGRVVVAHLGNGASMAAIVDGQSIDTTMGFTPTSGLVMGTRSGDIDPGVVLYLMEEKHMTPRAVNAVLDQQSGLLGISGTSADMRDLLAIEATDAHAAEAVALFCYRAKKYLGAFAAVMGGVDILVFTGGIGEKAAVIRERICAGQGYLGIELDRAANQVNAPVISARGSAVTVRVIAANEERMIARDTSVLLDTRHTTGIAESLHA